MYFLDSRLMQLRNVLNPHDFVDITYTESYPSTVKAIGIEKLEERGPCIELMCSVYSDRSMGRDAETTVEQLKQIVRRFCEERDWDKYHSAKDLAIGIVTEGSELLERFRFKSDGEIETMFKVPQTRARLCDELSDTLYFVLRLAQRYDVDLATELGRKMAENARRYPLEKAKGSNKKYNE